MILYLNIEQNDVGKINNLFKLKINLEIMITGLVKSITEREFTFSTAGSPTVRRQGSILELETPQGKVVVGLPDYHAGIADRKFLIGSTVEYLQKQHDSGGHWTERIQTLEYSLKVLDGPLEGEEFKTSVAY